MRNELTLIGSVYILIDEIEKVLSVKVSKIVFMWIKLAVIAEVRRGAVRRDAGEGARVATRELHDFVAYICLKKPGIQVPPRKYLPLPMPEVRGLTYNEPSGESTSIRLLLHLRAIYLYTNDRQKINKNK